MAPTTRRNSSFTMDVQKLIAKGYYEAGEGKLISGKRGYQKFWAALLELGVDIGEGGSALRVKVREKAKSFSTKGPNGITKPTHHYLNLLKEIGIPLESVVDFDQAIENKAYSKTKSKEKKRKDPSTPSTSGSKKPSVMEYKEKKREEPSTPSTGGSKKPSAMVLASPLSVATSTNSFKTPGDQPTPITSPDGRHSVPTFPVPGSWSSASRLPSFASSAVARMPARGSAMTPSSRTRAPHISMDSPHYDILLRGIQHVNGKHLERQKGIADSVSTLVREERARKAARRAKEAQEDDVLYNAEVSAYLQLGQVADQARDDEMDYLYGSFFATDTIHEGDEAVGGFVGDEFYAALESNGEAPNLDRPGLESAEGVALESYVAAEGNDDVPNSDRPALEPTGDVALDSGGDPEPKYRDEADEEPADSSDKGPSPDRPSLESSTVGVAVDPQDENRDVGTNGAKAPKRGWFGIL